LSGRGLCDELITRPEEFYRLCCVVVCDLETSRIGAPYIYDIRNLRVNTIAAITNGIRKCNAKNRAGVALSTANPPPVLIERFPFLRMGLLMESL